MMKNSFYTRAKLHLYFLKSTLEIALICQIAGSLFLYPTAKLMNNADASVNPILFYVPFGLFIDLMYKEFAQKDTYYFYYNQGISKAEQWLASICCWEILLIIINLIFKLCVTAWKWIA